MKKKPTTVCVHEARQIVNPDLLYTHHERAVFPLLCPRREQKQTPYPRSAPTSTSWGRRPPFRLLAVNPRLTVRFISKAKLKQQNRLRFWVHFILVVNGDVIGLRLTSPFCTLTELPSTLLRKWIFRIFSFWMKFQKEPKMHYRRTEFDLL